MENTKSSNDEDDTKFLVEKILSNNQLKLGFDKVTNYIQSTWRISTDEISSSILSFLISNNIIETHGGQIYNFTDKGKAVLKQIIERQL